MLSVQPLSNNNCHQFSYPASTSPTETMIAEVNSNRKKHPSGASRLDTEAILVILETVLQTHSGFTSSQSQHPSPVNGDRSRQCQSQTEQSLHTKSTASSTKDLRTISSIPASPIRSQSQPCSGSKATVTPYCGRIPQTGSSTAKIEQAMDSAKMELLCTVRKEVSNLQSKLASLLQHQAKLEEENRFLRSAAAPETLAKLGETQRNNSTSSTLPATTDLNRD